MSRAKEKMVKKMFQTEEQHMPRFSGRQEHGQCHWDPRVKSLSLKQSKEKRGNISLEKLALLLPK